MTVSGKTTSSAPCLEASSILSHTLSVVAFPSKRTGAIWTAAARTRRTGCAGEVTAEGVSERPGVQDERAVSAVQEDEIEDVERADGPHALDEGRLAVPVECLKGE